MGGINKLVISLAAAIGLASALPSCRYQNMNTMGRVSPAPYTELQCFEPGNDEGFSFEVPACDCSAGIRLRYVARRVEGRIQVSYEYESGFRNPDGSNIRMVSGSTARVEHLFIGGRELPEYSQASDEERAQWDMSKESFTSMWNNYAPVVQDMFRTCTEDRLDRELESIVRK